MPPKRKIKGGDCNDTFLKFLVESESKLNEAILLLCAIIANADNVQKNHLEGNIDFSITEDDVNKGYKLEIIIGSTTYSLNDFVDKVYTAKSGLKDGFQKGGDGDLFDLIGWVLSGGASLILTLLKGLKNCIGTLFHCLITTNPRELASSLPKLLEKLISFPLKLSSNVITLIKSKVDIIISYFSNNEIVQGMKTKLENLLNKLKDSRRDKYELEANKKHLRALQLVLEAEAEAEENNRQEAARQEAARQEAARREAARREAARREDARRKDATQVIGGLKKRGTLRMSSKPSKKSNSQKSKRVSQF